MENNKRILVVDDHAHIRRVIELKFKNQGYQVMTATNGEEGLNLIKTHQPDIVITDIMMPKMDGRSLCEQANQLKKQRSFLTIVMTCRISPSDQDWIGEMQDTVFVEKPFSLSTIMKYVDQYFGKQG